MHVCQTTNTTYEVLSDTSIVFPLSFARLENLARRSILPHPPHILHAYIRRRVNREYTCDKTKLNMFSFCTHLVLRNWYEGALRDEIPVRVWSQLSQYDFMHPLRRVSV